MNFIKSILARKTANVAGILLMLGLYAWGGPAGAVRLVAVGDVHGAYDQFVAILQRTQIINASRHWIAGKAILVQTGDILDRGSGGKKSMDLLMQLEQEASKQGGRVIALLGNHEVMNMMGDLRYVPATEYVNYSDSQSENRRHKAYQQYVDLAQSKGGSQTRPSQTAEVNLEEDWLSKHPAGFVEQREAFSHSGKYGRWLRTHLTVTSLNGVVFLHGGIDPALAEHSIDEINRQVQKELSDFDSCAADLVKQGKILPFATLEEILAAMHSEEKLDGPCDRMKEIEGWLSVSPTGPLWFRGYAQWPDNEGTASIAPLLKTYGATHFVVGHTPQGDGKIQSRFNGSVFLIDTGMLDSTFYPGGRPSALEIVGDKFTPIYLAN